jgi:hypothetical protein
MTRLGRNQTRKQQRHLMAVFARGRSGTLA